MPEQRSSFNEFPLCDGCAERRKATKIDHPGLPVTSDELAAVARDCHAVGAGAIHLHVRDALQQHSLDAAHYREAIAAISDACPEIAIQISTEAVGRFDLDTQIGLVKTFRPSAVSFSIAELMREGVRKGEAFLAWAAKENIGIQFILYDPRQIAELARHYAAGTPHLEKAPRIIVVAGRYSATQDSEVSEIEQLHRAKLDTGLAQESIWMACAFGRGEIACLERTIELVAM